MNQTEKIDILAQEMIRFNRNDPKRIQQTYTVFGRMCSAGS